MDATRRQRGLHVRLTLVLAAMLCCAAPASASLARSYDALGQPRQAGTLLSGALYAPNGALAQFSYGSGVLHTRTQNARRLPERSRDALGGTALHDLTYGYDAAGNVSGIVDALGGRTSRTLGYDGLDRLTAASAPQLWGTGSFSYDPLDGLRTASLGSRAYSYGYDAQERLSAVTDGGGAPVLALGYDGRGRVVQRNGIALGFDLGERLTSLGGEGYRYDAHGRRVRIERADGSRRYTQYDRTGVLRYALEAGSGEATPYVPFGGALTALRIGTAGTVRYVHGDALGSPAAVSDASGGLLGRLEYEPYGVLWSGVPAISGQVGYTGHEQQPVGGLVYAQARYYEPIAGRFLSPDPVGVDTRTGQHYDRYGYARDNPYRYVDPDGRSGVAALGGLFVESWNAAHGLGFDGDRVLGAFGDGYDGEGDGFAAAAFDDASAVATVAGGVGALKAVASLARQTGQQIASRLAARSASQAARSASRVSDAARKIEDWLGPGAKTIRNDAGDLVAVSRDGSRRVRFDVNRPYPHENPHGHVEELVNGRWVKSGPIFPKDVTPK
jgi:RHS repeat-associated protein